MQVRSAGVRGGTGASFGGDGCGTVAVPQEVGAGHPAYQAAEMRQPADARGARDSSRAQVSERCWPRGPCPAGTRPGLARGSLVRAGLPGRGGPTRTGRSGSPGWPGRLPGLPAQVGVVWGPGGRPAAPRRSIGSATQGGSRACSTLGQPGRARHAPRSPTGLPARCRSARSQGHNGFTRGDDRGADGHRPQRHRGHGPTNARSRFRFRCSTTGPPVSLAGCSCKCFCGAVVVEMEMGGRQPVAGTVGHRVRCCRGSSAGIGRSWQLAVLCHVTRGVLAVSGAWLGQPGEAAPVSATGHSTTPATPSTPAPV